MEVEIIKSEFGKYVYSIILLSNCYFPVKGLFPPSVVTLISGFRDEFVILVMHYYRNKNTEN